MPRTRQIVGHNQPINACANDGDVLRGGFGIGNLFINFMERIIPNPASMQGFSLVGKMEIRGRDCVSDPVTMYRGYKIPNW